MLHSVVVLLALSIGSGGCDDSEEEDISGGDGETAEVREIVLTGPPVEDGAADPFGGPQPELWDVIRQIDDVREAAHAKGIFLQVGPMGGEWGAAGDLRRALARVREAHKPVHCHFEMADNLAYVLLATSCDRISMTPAGWLDLVGVSAHVFYARSLLANIGVEAELMQIGRYKGAADTFTLDDMPEPVREALGAMLDDLSAALVRAVAARTGRSPEEARALLDGGPFDSDRARRAGLIDDVGFDDEAREHARVAGGVERVRRIRLTPEAEPMGLGELLDALSGEQPDEEPEEPRLVLVRLSGTIVDAEESGPGGGRSGPFVRALRRFARDENVKAIVLRIDSPGGSALASDRMWHAVRAAARHKPVIVSIGSMAASGGYYIASAGTTILAHDESLVGSIGVVGGKVNLAGLAERIGLHVVVMDRGQNATWSSPVRPMDDAERAVLERMLRSTYRRFLRRVEVGRELSPERVAAAAEGRLMTARVGRELGLVDEVGGLADAIDRARREGGLGEDAPIEIWPRRQGALEALAELLGAPSPEDETRHVLRALGPELAPVADAILATPRLLARERVAVTLPYVVDIR